MLHRLVTLHISIKIPFCIPLGKTRVPAEGSGSITAGCTACMTECIEQRIRCGHVAIRRVLLLWDQLKVDSHI